MKYYRTYWEQSSLEYATWIFSEVDNQGYEIRKLEIFLDGKISYYDANIPFELGEFPTDEDLESINDSEEITVIEISKNDFEIVKAYLNTGKIWEAFLKKDDKIYLNTELDVSIDVTDIAEKYYRKS